MTVIIDAFGGDNAPLEVLKGAERAVKELGVDILLTGDETKINACAKDNGISLDGMTVAHTAEIFDIHEEPTEIIKSGRNTSMALGFQMLKDGRGDAFLSAGSTGALVVGATMIVKRIKGIKRVALAPIIPADKGPVILMDGGANLDCRPEMLVQFAMMGSAYMEKVLGISNPKVGLANIGSEDTKGRELDIETYKLLSNSNLNFVGNMEAREMPGGEIQVVVTDGFSGNLMLKLYEGMGSFFSKKLKWVFGGFNGKLAALPVIGKIKVFKKQMDYKEVGGAVLMGASKPVIKAHGSSDAKAFFNAVRQAKMCVDGRVVDEIAASVGEK